MIPPATSINYVPWAIIGYVFQYLIRRRRFSWWAKYNCKFYFYYSCFVESVLVLDVLSAALDSGTALGVVLIFFWSVLTTCVDGKILIVW